VTGLSEKTGEAELRKFFSFCGKLDSLERENGGKSTLLFEKASAAKTASFLSGGTLDGAMITVIPQGEKSHAAEETAAPQQSTEEIAQSDKPRSAVAAELISHGYVLSDQTIAKAIELDTKYGVSQRFSDFIQPLIAKAKQMDQDKKISERATTMAQDTDAKYNVSARGNQVTQIGKSYYEKALSSSFGAQIQSFYLRGAKEVQAVHEEARRIADARKADSAASNVAPPSTGSDTHPPPPATEEKKTEAAPPTA